VQFCKPFKLEQVLRDCSFRGGIAMKTKFLCAAVALALGAAMTPASASTLIVNGGFDDVSVTAASAGLSFPYVTLPNYAYPAGPGGSATVGGWTYSLGTPGGGSGLVGYPPAGDPFFGGPAPLSGSQYAFVQDNGSISQSFQSAVAGTTTITWYQAGRTNNGGGENYEVLLNGSLLGSYSTFASQPWTLEIAAANLKAGTNTLEFLGTSVYVPAGNQNDVTGFLENVSVSAIPEASTWVMLLLGFAGVGFMAYRRKSNPGLIAA
jgi:hypothetical protein